MQPAVGVPVRVQHHADRSARAHSVRSMDMDLRTMTQTPSCATNWLWVLLMLVGVGVSAVTQAGTVTYVYTDAQGTPLAKADANGNIIATFDYAPYGAQALGTPPSGPGYTGHVNDPDTGLVYMQARYYDPVVGRFLSVDPITPAAGNLFNFNRYDYANNNPYKFTDPDGRATVYRYAHKVVIVQTFKNNGTQFTNDQIKAQGASLSGHTSDGKTVVVQFAPGNDKDAVQLNPNPKLDDTSKDGALRSHADKIGGRSVEIAPNAAGEGTVGHELGHVLHAGDQYNGGIGADGKTVTSDVAGPMNIMKNAVGFGNTQTVNEIYKGASSKDNTQINCIDPKAGC